MKRRAAVIGAGSWGCTLASLLATNTPTISWVREQEAAVADEINSAHTNETYVPGVTLNESLRATTSLEEAARDADLLVMAVPSHWFRSVLEQLSPHVRADVPVVSVVKGLEEKTMLRMTQVIEEVIPGHPVGALGGPNIAKEIAAGIASATVLAIDDVSLAVELRRLFTTGRFRVYTNSDVTGCEIGGALKNVIAIAAGLSDGAGGGDNTRAAIITRGLAEVTRLGVAMGGAPQTFAGLAGLGDLVVTCTSPFSRNRTVGEQLGRGRKLDDIIGEMHMVAEGVKTAGVVTELAESFDVPAPVARVVESAISGSLSAANAFRAIMRHEAGFEHEPD